MQHTLSSFGQQRCLGTESGPRTEPVAPLGPAVDLGRHLVEELGDLVAAAVAARLGSRCRLHDVSPASERYPDPAPLPARGGVHVSQAGGVMSQPNVSFFTLVSTKSCSSLEIQSEKTLQGKTLDVEVVVTMILHDIAPILLPALLCIMQPT